MHLNPTLTIMPEYIRDILVPLFWKIIRTEYPDSYHGYLITRHVLGGRTWIRLYIYRL